MTCCQTIITPPPTSHTHTHTQQHNIMVVMECGSWCFTVILLPIDHDSLSVFSRYSAFPVTGDWRLCFGAVSWIPSFSGDITLSLKSFSRFPRFLVKGSFKCRLVKEKSLTLSDGEVEGRCWFRLRISSGVRQRVNSEDSSREDTPPCFKILMGSVKDIALLFLLCTELKWCSLERYSLGTTYKTEGE